MASPIISIRDLTVSYGDHCVLDGVNLDIERDKILTSEAALDYGLIDSILESRKAVAIGAGSGAGR